MIIAMVVTIVSGCSRHTKTPESVAKHFVDSINKGNLGSLDAITPAEFFEGWAIDCTSLKMCTNGDGMDQLRCTVEVFRDQIHHNACDQITVRADWFEFVRALSEDLAPCNLRRVYQADPGRRYKMQAELECDGIEDTFALAQREDGSWYLSGYYNGQFLNLRQRVRLEQVVKMVNQ